MKRNILKLSFITLVIAILNINIVFAGNNINLDRLEEVINVVNENYKEEVSNKQLIDGAIKGMLETLDPHSTYLTKKEYQQLLESLNGDFSGIGVSIKKIDEYIQVIEVIKDSPAEASGLKEGDKFYSVNGTNVVDIKIEKFVSMVRGKKGTKVKVGVLRDNLKEPVYFEIVRDEIAISSVEYEIIEDNIGYLRIYNFNKNIQDKIAEALKHFDKNNIDKIIVDLRGNPGGYLSQVVQMSKDFIPEGPIVHVKKRGMTKQTYKSYLEDTKYELAVLVNDGSASASEIFAGAVQDHEVGKLIGEKTYGKGTVQTFFQLNNGDYVKLSIAKYFTPNERNIDGKGLTPDIIVEDEKFNTEEFEPMNIFRSIFLKNRGKDVLAVEQRLKTLGYISSEPDYIYDSETKDGVFEFKKEYKCIPNSVITKRFQRILDKKIKNITQKDEQLEKAIKVLNN